MRINLSRLWRYIVFTTALLILITLITGLIPNPSDASIIGSYYYGFPKYWLVRIPLQHETNFIAKNFVLNFLIFYTISAFFLSVINWRKAWIRKTGGLKFLTVFALSAFFMKIVAEFVHEVLGHGLFVLLFGGKITNVNIALSWPYNLSSIGWSGNFANWQMVWIHGGGILICLIFTGILQMWLILNVVRNRKLVSVFFWLSFWTFLNPTGYLILGGISPFGDIIDLISDGILTKQISLAIGTFIFLLGFLSLSRIFSDIIYRTEVARNKKKIRFYLTLFWLLTFLLTGVAIIGNHWSITYLPIGLLPAIATLFIPIRILSGQRSKPVE